VSPFAVQLLIQSSKEYGIDLNAKNNNGGTALHLAFIIGRTEIIQLLFQSSKEYGIDLNARDDLGQTVLHCACFGGSTATETVRLLMKNRQEFAIDIKDAQDNEGKTALDSIKEVLKWDPNFKNIVKKRFKN